MAATDFLFRSSNKKLTLLKACLRHKIHYRRKNLKSQIPANNENSVSKPLNILFAAI